MKRYEYFQNLQKEAEKARARTVRRYLRDIAAVLPCKRRQKKEILHSLRTIIDSRGSGALESRAQLEAEIGTPESIVQTYIGDDAVPLLRRSMRIRRLAVIAAVALFLTQAAVLCFALTAPQGHYEETVRILDNGFETTTLPQLGSDHIALLRTGAKTVTYYDNHNAKVWSITVTGSFGYIYGSTSQALESDYEIILYRPGAALSDERNYMAGNMAFASGTVTYDELTLLKNVSLTCDAYGELH